MDDAAYRLLQHELMDNPTAGAVIEGTGGLRKLCRADPRRGKGKRGGLRVIYYGWSGGDQFWLFTVYDKDPADDLTPVQRKVPKQLLKTELENRQPTFRAIDPLLLAYCEGPQAEVAHTSALGGMHGNMP